MNKIKHFMLPEHTNKLYSKEAASSLALTKDIAKKINEIVDALNKINSDDLLWKHEQEGRIEKGVLFMKDNLLNSLHDLLKLFKDSGEIESIITESIIEGYNALKLRTADFVSVKEYGAVGDGITDDTESIQNTINSGVKVIYIPSGTYKVKTLIIPSDITIIGSGKTTIIKQNTLSTTHLFKNSDFDSYANGEYRDVEDGCVKNVTIENLKIEGSNIDGTHGIALYGYNFTLHDIELSNFDGVGIYLEAPGELHSTETQNLQNDIYNIVCSHCVGGNIYYNGQSDSVFNNVLAYYDEGFTDSINVYLGEKAHGCKFNGVHLWGEANTHLVVDCVGSTFSNLHAEGAYTQIEINNRFTTMTAEIYDPIHDSGTTGFKFGELAGNFNGVISCRNIETVFDYQGYSPYGHNINGHVSQNMDGVLFTNYPTAPFINIQWYANGEYKWETVTPWATLKDTWSNFNTNNPPSFDVKGERVFATVNNGTPTSYIVLENGNSVRGSKIRMGGTEADADLQLEPKGNGLIRFGSHTSGIGEINGYIQIKDSDGNIRKLACID